MSTDIKLEQLWIVIQCDVKHRRFSVTDLVKGSREEATRVANRDVPAGSKANAFCIVDFKRPPDGRSSKEIYKWLISIGVDHDDTWAIISEIGKTMIRMVKQAMESRIND